MAPIILEDQENGLKCEVVKNKILLTINGRHRMSMDYKEAEALMEILKKSMAEMGFLALISWAKNS